MSYCNSTSWKESQRCTSLYINTTTSHITFTPLTTANKKFADIASLRLAPLRYGDFGIKQTRWLDNSLCIFSWSTKIIVVPWASSVTLNISIYFNRLDKWYCSRKNMYLYEHAFSIKEHSVGGFAAFLQNDCGVISVHYGWKRSIADTSVIITWPIEWRMTWWTKSSVVILQSRNGQWN